MTQKKCSEQEYLSQRIQKKVGLKNIQILDISQFDDGWRARLALWDHSLSVPIIREIYSGKSRRTRVKALRALNKILTPDFIIKSIVR